jgi:hypothetical protein
VYSFSPPPEALNEYYSTSCSSSEQLMVGFDTESDALMGEEGPFLGMEP